MEYKCGTFQNKTCGKLLSNESILRTASSYSDFYQQRGLCTSQ